MQKAPTATVSAGPVSPAIVGPDGERKDVYILTGLVGFMAIIVAGFWYFSQTEEATHSKPASETIGRAEVSQAFKTPTDTLPVTPSMPVVSVSGVPPATRSTDILHDDIHFEIGRKGLTDDAKASLQRHAEFLMSEPDWGILLQGYTDQQGSAGFNKVLGMKRAETVKQHLMTWGVPASSIRTVSLGEDGALCIDNSDLCRHLNRRVHLEMRKIGHEHMVAPTMATETVSDLFSNRLDVSEEPELAGSSRESAVTSIVTPAEAEADSTDGN
jgi:peptidoglycan-associated lipoprotein